ncbi:MAG: GNAT family N-acetyltransferase [Vulcanimicrobiaceae bacterium]|jgi:RimJ/RimL family protein N-acetyltransferase
MLIGSLVELTPLRPEHAADLFEAGREPEIWRYLPITGFESLGAVEAWIAEAEQAEAAGKEQPFAVIDLRTGRAVGSTRYLDIRPQERAREIGWTWLTPSVQRTGLNRETKFLLLRHAFETLGVLRVAFFTDAENGRSRSALVRLGATYEGTLRLHRARERNNFSRDSAAYSVIAPDWPGVKLRLELWLGRHARLTRSVR